MGLGDLFKASKNKALVEENQRLKASISDLNLKIQELEDKLLPEHNNVDALNEQINELEKEKLKSEDNLETIAEKISALEKNIEIKQQELNECQNKKSDLELECDKLQKQQEKEERKIEHQKIKLRSIKSLINSARYAVNNYGLIEPFNNFGITKEQYDAIDELTPTTKLPLQSDNIKDLRQLNKDLDERVDDILAAYEKRYLTKSNRSIYHLMVLSLRAELQNILTSIKYNKLDFCLESLNTMIAKYLKISTDGNQTIAPTLNKFIAEIHVLFKEMVGNEYEYYVRKEQIRAEQQALRDQMRQEAEERKALEQQQKQIEKEESKYQTEIENINRKLEKSDDNEKNALLLAKIKELQDKLNRLNEQKEEIINRQNGKAGYVYVISNLGSFGENTFKVGMTRRLDPMDRVRELGDASVPFPFDVHSFIFSDDAVGLETELHHRLEPKRKNKINSRKEFFDISLDELELLVQQVNPAAEFQRTMLASEYRQSQSVQELLESR